MHTRFRYEYLKGRHYLEYLGINRIIILKRILNRLGRCKLDLSGLGEE